MKTEYEQQILDLVELEWQKRIKHIVFQFFNHVENSYTDVTIEADLNSPQIIDAIASLRSNSDVIEITEEVFRISEYEKFKNLI